MFDKLPRNRIHADGSDWACADPGGFPPDLQTGHEAIAEAVLAAFRNGQQKKSIMAIDATHGADLAAVISELAERLEHQSIRLQVYFTEDYLYTGSELRRRFDRHITDNRVFGYRADGVSFTEYFRPGAAACWAEEIDTDLKQHLSVPQIFLICGPGARWLGGDRIDLSFYCDVSREYQQQEHRRSLRNFGFSWNRDRTEKYKICLFLEWPIRETYRKQNLSRFDYYVDLNRPSEPVLTASADLIRLLAETAKQPFRVKPFFAPGVWGGQYLKQLCGLPSEWENCAWSFEPIAPENTILLEYRDRTIEVPFSLLLGCEHRAVMGDRIAALFGDYFPIRFDYLDTMDGGDLSCQVHPKPSYIEDTFNEKMAQQESYYIMQRRSGAKVYLGLKDDTSPEEFLEAAKQSHETDQPLAFESYVNAYDSEKGALYLVPPETIHCAGKNNLVLEISSTTWWFTFKIYDYMRRDLDGKPRPLNLEHAKHNVQGSLSEKEARTQLIPLPRLIGRQGNNKEHLLGEHDELLFSVKRISLVDHWEDDTNGEFVMYNLVEGESVRLVPLSSPAGTLEFGYAESCIVPASVGAYRLENTGNTPCKLVKAGVAAHWQTPLLPHGWLPNRTEQQ
ncbi:class I mannose-6-phosphate isomerase [Saccharibacillus qingshengii]|uniref:class I mannose-6-phosphate isomerase n=1 Tax=Saccharibacillus qingshengii TaxID=1763540 RepID=UPI001556444B|nr:class I mannose-6-phosphate isomerase [Saccharibacillus qingshengii]